MTTEQQDWNDDRARRGGYSTTSTNFQLGQKQPEYVEIVRKKSTGYDPRESETFYSYERLGVYSSRLNALEAILKMHPELSIEPLKVDD